MKLMVKGVSCKGVKKKRISLRKFRREAIKTKIHPRFSNKGATAKITRSKYGKVKLDLSYGSPVSVNEAAESFHDYEVLSNDIGEVEWWNPTTQVNADMFFNGKWILTSSKVGLLEKYLDGGEVLFALGMKGPLKGLKEKLSSEFKFFAQADNYKEIGVRGEAVGINGGLPMIVSPFVYFTCGLDGLDVDKIIKKQKFAKDVKQPYWNLGNLGYHKRELSINDDETEVFSLKKTNTSIHSWNLFVPQGIVGGRELIAKYVPKDQAELNLGLGS